MQRIAGIEALHSLIGQELGTSPWLNIDQARIQAFADATDDHQWIHLDQARAKQQSPFGTTIAHGFLTLSMLPYLNQQIFALDNISATINYGMNRVRFTAPVPSGANIRTRVTLTAVEPQGDQGVRATFETHIEIEGQDRPACIAEHLAVFLK
ncbi:MaoC family dehydratase [Mangrovitalea sediminis]|uniref:MaoC family dehydratase n=1 Tax=Mangrovitalea sediminis TaxID=1982043 RepID=UPI000BE56562|nr:MaoC family dehydratase [Mangrovitalea sediminis]